MKRAVDGKGSIHNLCRGLLAVSATLALLVPSQAAHAAGTRERCEKLLTRYAEGDVSLSTVYAAIERHLTAQQVRFTRETDEDGNPILVVSADRRAPARLNQWAASVNEKHGTRFIFDLAHLAEKGSKASFVRATDSSPALIRLPIEEILDPDRMSSSLAHEIIHSVTQWHLERGDELAFYGDVKVADENENAELPGTTPDLVSGKRSYPRRFSFDEVQTHLGQSRFLVRHSDGAGRTLRARLARGLRLAGQTERFARAGLERVAKVRPNFKVERGVVVGRSYVTLDGVRVRLRIPLVRSKGLGDARGNRDLMRQQLERLAEWAAGRAADLSRLK